MPNAKSFEKLKRVGRYCIKAPRMVYGHDWQACTDNVLDVCVDTDFDGCVVTRRSTSDGIIMNGGHCVKHCSTTQSTIALSSGEAELHGISKGFSHALGIQALARYLGFDYKIRVHSDAAAAIGIARRRGLGRIRHLDVEDLWVQDCLRQGRVELVKIASAENPADALTKHVDRSILKNRMAKINVVPMEGRSPEAPQLPQE